MADATKTALDESRMLMLGAQILLGFQLQAPFQDAFAALSSTHKQIEIAVLGLLVLVVGLLIAPSARHRIVERGEATAGINRFITRVSFVVLAPFAAALALDLFIAGALIAGPSGGWMAGLGAAVLALVCWYGPLAIRKSPREDAMSEKTPIATKIEYVLTEARVVLPGAQALLGFQLAILVTTGFGELPAAARALHGIALGLVAVATILLMAPAAYHRIVHAGRSHDDVYIVASRFLLAATVFLAFGLAADIHVVVVKITHSGTLANALACATAAILILLWHVWPCWLRRRKRRAGEG